MDVGSIFSEAVRRDPYPLYSQMRAVSPVLRVPPPFDAWMVFDYDGVRRVLTDVETFSSRVPAPQWFIFFDPPVHTKLRGLISRAFTPGVVTGQEARIREISRTLLDAHSDRGEIDLATEYSVPLAMRVISRMRASCPATTPGVNAREIRPRSLVCTGGSKKMNHCGAGT